VATCGNTSPKISATICSGFTDVFFAFFVGPIALSIIIIIIIIKIIIKINIQSTWQYTVPDMVMACDGSGKRILGLPGDRA